MVTRTSSVKTKTLRRKCARPVFSLMVLPLLPTCWARSAQAVCFKRGLAHRLNHRRRRQHGSRRMSGRHPYHRADGGFSFRLDRRNPRCALPNLMMAFRRFCWQLPAAIFPQPEPVDGAFVIAMVNWVHNGAGHLYPETAPWLPATLSRAERRSCSTPAPVQAISCALVPMIIVLGRDWGCSTTVLQREKDPIFGVGVQPPTPKLGNIILNQTYFPIRPCWCSFFPRAAIGCADGDFIGWATRCAMCLNRTLRRV